ncbi:hypothetical protein BX616_007646, partial [Lobosporangium transversale]
INIITTVTNKLTLVTAIGNIVKGFLSSYAKLTSIYPLSVLDPGIHLSREEQITGSGVLVACLSEVSVSIRLVSAQKLQIQM